MQDADIKKRPPAQKNRVGKTKSSKKIESTFSNSVTYISTFILLILTLLIYDLIYLSNTNINVHFEPLKTELVNSVYNQPKALAALAKSLDRIEENENIVEIVNFIGSTGVGKTFVANILKKEFSPSVHELSGSFKVNSFETILNTVRNSHFRYNLIIVDDLTIHDLENVLLLLKKIPEDVNVLVVCIFNIQEVDNFLNYTINYNHFNLIENEFNKSGINHEVAKFHEFTTDEAANWIVKELLKKEVEAHLHSKIVESLLASQNVKYHGLKGLSSKINLEL